jgi:dihydropteroate synthase
MVNKIIHTNPVTALNGTTVLHTIALLNGAKMLRVHDVSEAKQAIELVEYYKNA